LARPNVPDDDTNHHPNDDDMASIEEAAAAADGVNSSCSLTMRPKDLSPELVHEILDYKGIFADDEEEEVCRVRTRRTTTATTLGAL
jgi:hypothetical protein